MSEFDKCLASAQRSLAMREHSSFQIKNKLLSKGFNTEIIESVLLEIQQTGFQSDALTWLDDRRYMLQEFSKEQGHTIAATGFIEQTKFRVWFKKNCL